MVRTLRQVVELLAQVDLFLHARKNASPAVLNELAPPRCYFGIDAKARRFKMKFRETPRPNVWAGRAANCSRNFSNRPWLDALKEVRQEAWQRWEPVKDQKLFRCDRPQTPSETPERIANATKDCVDVVPERVKY